MKSFVFTVLFVFFCTIASAETFQFDGKTLWTREPDTGTLDVKDGVYRIEHAGEKDWAVSLCSSIPVKAGETFRVTATLTLEGTGQAGVAVGLFDTDNKIISWTHGNTLHRGNCTEKVFTDEFIIPRGASTILPRLMGGGNVKAVVSGIKLEKLDKIAVLDPVVLVPEAGAGVLDLVPQGTGFAQKLEFKGPAFSADRHQKPLLKLDMAQTFEDKPTWRISARDGLAFDMQPTEPIKAQVGDRILVALWINLERGKPQLDVYSWQGGIVRKDRHLATGTFRPDVGEEGGKWCCIHAYVTVPEGTEGLVPVVHCPSGGVFNLAHWTLSRPSAETLDPVRKKVEGYAQERREETFDRGLVAVRTEEGVYLGWRLLKSDAPGTGFDVYRYDADGKETKLNEKPIVQTTDFLDRAATKDDATRWSVRVSGTEKGKNDTPVAALDQPYVSFKLKDGDSIDRIAFADLDGDDRLDYVVKTPGINIDPYYMYWYKSPETYKLQAYKSDGSFMWEYDLGWGIERGIWYSPYIVADLDGDGRAEIAVKTCPGDFRDMNGRVYTGPERLSILDGETGKERASIDWPEREGLPYNLSSRHQLAVAYLDGKTPCLIVLRGTYNRMTAVAYQMLAGPDKLEELWRWDNRWERELGRWGQGAHTTHTFDIDGDGREEILLGSIALDDDGSVLWELKLGHPDHMYLGDLDPSRPGMEIVYGIETRQQERNGVCMVDAKTGEILWGHDKPTKHIHANGMVADIDARHPGCETWSGEQDSLEDRWLRDAKGKVLETPEGFPRTSLGPRTIWWDAGLQQKMLLNNRPVSFPSMEPVGDIRFEGTLRLVGDVLGDWREEAVMSHNGEVRIYTTTIPAKDRRTTFLQDRNYRATMIESTMGYWQNPLPSRDLKKQ